ncbi:unnamed protein product [Rotaria sordida]|uniref:Uncharacterized protein n=1 Tax=Rotaria sordida TaxID=392033 RepID=A0A815B421_9BILA|nr:unnamed protein product [Rotaria sordida]CAF3792067.1 unnamed protein product [Rotaria sordida]
MPSTVIVVQTRCLCYFPSKENLVTPNIQSWTNLSSPFRHSCIAYPKGMIKKVSSRKLANEFNISTKLVRRISKDNLGLRSYKKQVGPLLTKPSQGHKNCFLIGYESYPPVQRQFPFSLSQWEQLVSLLDLETFTALADRIGCPGCADGGIEWIQVDWPDATKRVTFESGQLFKGLEGFVVNLRQMREKYVAQL